MIKGATSYKETSLGILPRNKLIKLEIEGNKKGLEFIYSLKSSQRNKPIDVDLILKLHKVSYGWIFPKWAGKFRTIQVTFSGKEATEFYKIRELIINLCLDLKERIKSLPSKDESQYITKIVKTVSWFQHQFVLIHPFNDYNGRMARMLTILLLLKLKLPPIEIKVEKKNDRKNYIKAMQKADEGDYSNLESLIAEALEEGLSKFDK